MEEEADLLFRSAAVRGPEVDRLSGSEAESDKAGAVYGSRTDTEVLAEGAFHLWLSCRVSCCTVQRILYIGQSDL
jgi:hypothetical protein